MLRVSLNQLVCLPGDKITELIEKNLIDVRHVRSSLTLKKGELLDSIGQLQQIQPTSDDEATVIAANIGWAETQIKLIETILQFFPQPEVVKMAPKVRPSMASIREILRQKASK